MQFGHDALAQPVRRVVLAQGMAGVDVDQFLVHAFQNVFFDIGEVVLTNQIEQLAKGGRQGIEVGRLSHPVKKVALDEVRHVQRVERIARQHAAQFVVVGLGGGLQYRIGQQLGKHTQVRVHQIDGTVLVELSIGQLQETLPLLERHLHGGGRRCRVGHRSAHGLGRVDEGPRRISEVELNLAQRRAAALGSKQVPVEKEEERLFVVAPDLELLYLPKPETTRRRVAEQDIEVGGVDAPHPTIGGDQRIGVALAAVPLARQVLGELVFGVPPGLREVFLPFDDDIAVGNVGVTGFRHAFARDVEDGLFATVRHLVDDRSGIGRVFEQAVQQVLEPQLLRFFGMRCTHAGQIVCDFFAQWNGRHKRVSIASARCPHACPAAEPTPIRSACREGFDWGIGRAVTAPWPARSSRRPAPCRAPPGSALAAPASAPPPAAPRTRRVARRALRESSTRRCGSAGRRAGR